METVGQVGLLSHSEIDELVAARDKCRAVMDYTQADQIKSLLEKNHVEIADISYRFSGNSQWTYKTAVVEEVETNLMELAHESFNLISDSQQTVESITTKAKAALRMQLFRGQEIGDPSADYKYSEPVVVLKSTEMQGRKYADAAFEFSMAGISDSELFNLLAECSAEELERFGIRRSCKPIHILQMVEKLSAAGVRSHRVYNVADAILQRKQEEAVADGNAKWRFDPVINYDLFSGRVLMLLWRYATKQTKPTKRTKSSANKVGGTKITGLKGEGDGAVADCETSEKTNNIETNLPPFQSLFADPTLPLVLDLGCGYGVSLLNLCDQCAHDRLGRKFNFLGADLSNRAIQYASGITSRWGYTDTCAFLYCDCTRILQFIRDEYPGPVSFVMVNFPTPYSIAAVLRHQDASPAPVLLAGATEVAASAHGGIEEGEAEAAASTDILRSAFDFDTKVSALGNTQLPDSFDNFMFNTELVALIQEVFQQEKQQKQHHPETGAAQALLLQSNVEDVVVTMRNIVLQAPTSTQAADVLDAPPRFTIPEIECLNQSVSGIFSPQSGDSSASSLPMQWRSQQELEASTDVASGGGRMSKRLETWLADMQVGNKKKRDIGEEGACEETAGVGVAARTRAHGHGWLARSPLPGNARTETEVYCEVEKQPVHRTMFLFK